MPSPTLIRRAALFPGHTALIEPDRTTHTYDALCERSSLAARTFLGTRDHLNGTRVAFLVSPGVDYVTTQWGIWRAGGIAVPLATMHPPEELAHVISDSDPAIVVVQRDLAEPIRSIVRQRGIRMLYIDELLAPQDGVLPTVSQNSSAMIVYTSGSTGKPKGVVTTHANIEAQLKSLVAAWGWSPQDRILLTLPLHHVHGIINVLGCSLWSGATCEVLTQFDAATVWQTFANSKLTVFMAVPTIYKKLIDYWLTANPADQQNMSRACEQFRVMVSGSAALPQTTFDTWQHITGHTLLERYGMTEIGMALSNPLDGTRRRGYVGTPLPNVDVKLVDENGSTVAHGDPGEIYVRGPLVFKEYWRRPGETRAAFANSWFKTGDVAIVEDGYYRVMGRRNVDIIKTGGYKVSALEIEDTLRTHPEVGDCAVVGLADDEWGERVAVAIEAQRKVELKELRQWAKDRLAPYKIPSNAVTVPALPRNAMGKVIKAKVTELFEGPQ